MADDSHGDVNMAENENPLLIPTAYNPPVRGWTEEMVKMNHCDDIVELIEGNPATCMAAVIMSYDVHDRESGPTAIKSILLAEKVADADKVDVFPPTPKEPVGLDGMPYTNIISDCTPAFKAAVLAANSVFYGMHDGVACTFYVFSVKPQTPWTIATFTGLSTLMSTDELKNAAYTCFLNDPSIVQMITANHGNIRDDHGNDRRIRGFNISDGGQCLGNVPLDMIYLSRQLSTFPDGSNRRSSSFGCSVHAARRFLGGVGRRFDAWIMGAPIKRKFGVWLDCVVFEHVSITF
ncbi:hypothetical protein DFH06DRAFT_1338463 [Mycena polygramma]|nr:hypothetical protein DFH06DRAFT_1338463 [Mycena polygramma]